MALTTPLGAQILEESEESGVDRLPRLMQMPPRAGKGFLEAHRVEWLEEKVERVDLEGAQGVIVVSRDEHDGWRPGPILRPLVRVAALEGLDDLEAIDFRHLDIEEDEVGVGIVDGAQRFGAVRTFGYHFDVGVLGEQRPHALTRELFVVDDRDANLGRIGNQSAAVRSREWYGIASATRTPPPGSASSSREKLSA